MYTLFVVSSVMSVLIGYKVVIVFVRIEVKQKLSEGTIACKLDRYIYTNLMLYGFSLVIKL